MRADGQHQRLAFLAGKLGGQRADDRPWMPPATVDDELLQRVTSRRVVGEQIDRVRGGARRQRVPCHQAGGRVDRHPGRPAVEQEARGRAVRIVGRGLVAVQHAPAVTVVTGVLSKTGVLAVGQCPTRRACRVTLS